MQVPECWQGKLRHSSISFPQVSPVFTVEGIERERGEGSKGMKFDFEIAILKGKHYYMEIHKPLLIDYQILWFTNTCISS